jgi:hypothetical protein
VSVVGDFAYVATSSYGLQILNIADPAAPSFVGSFEMADWWPRGVAVVGVFSFEIAETKVTQVMDYAQQHQHPLQCTMEKE